MVDLHDNAATNINNSILIKTTLQAHIDEKVQKAVELENRNSEAKGKKFDSESKTRFKTLII